MKRKSCQCGPKFDLMEYATVTMPRLRIRLFAIFASHFRKAQFHKLPNAVMIYGSLFMSVCSSARSRSGPRRGGGGGVRLRFAAARERKKLTERRRRTKVNRFPREAECMHGIWPNNLRHLMRLVLNMQFPRSLVTNPTQMQTSQTRLTKQYLHHLFRCYQQNMKSAIMRCITERATPLGWHAINLKRAGVSRLHLLPAVDLWKSPGCAPAPKRRQKRVELQADAAEPFYWIKDKLRWSGVMLWGILSEWLIASIMRGKMTTLGLRCPNQSSHPSNYIGESGWIAPPRRIYGQLLNRPYIRLWHVNIWPDLTLIENIGHFAITLVP